jgi:hypothetical protein
MPYPAHSTAAAHGYVAAMAMVLHGNLLLSCMVTMYNHAYTFLLASKAMMPMVRGGWLLLMGELDKLRTFCCAGFILMST